MARNLDSKCKRCRREGEKLYLKGEKCFTPKCPMVKRSYPPGVHGPKAQRRGSRRSKEYGAQLRGKQKAKQIYRILEKQFQNYVIKAMKKEGDSGENLLILLERRLDNIVYRLGLAKSRSIARQLVAHKHILVNNKVVNIPSAQVKIGDLITIREKSKKIFSDINKSTQKQEAASWLEFDYKNLTGKVISNPPFEEVKQTLDLPLIIEFYSR